MKNIILILFLAVATFCSAQEIDIQYQTKPVGKDSIDLVQVVFNPKIKPLSQNIVAYETMSKEDLKSMIIGTLAQQDTLIANYMKVIESLEKDQEKIRELYDSYPKQLRDQMDETIKRKEAVMKEIAISKQISEKLKALKI